MRIRPRHILPRALRTRLTSESGAAIVEFAVALPLFMLLFSGLIDLGRLGFSVVMAKSATDIAVRIAVVRPPACAGVPAMNTRGSTTITPLPSFGTSCSAATGICANPGTISCTGDASNPTAAEIWSKVEPLMPYGTTIANLNFSYRYDSDLGFLGGPYVPMVSVSLANANFQFVTPIWLMAEFYTGQSTGNSTTISLPAVPASLPGEDLAQGVSG